MKPRCFFLPATNYSYPLESSSMSQSYSSGFSSGYGSGYRGSSMGGGYTTGSKKTILVKKIETLNGSVVSEDSEIIRD
ncbi:keratin, type II cytoskeletal 8-like [Polyodon spathula]|uniref:keratin, type II cytoskeletal 8-like n=1 Tax=Polyodon spathula TaxID=7913 RepID=UPI001B7E5A42|nr:keratin, type II cytoskeletal 8-like [Polyodon spathula]